VKEKECFEISSLTTSLKINQYFCDITRKTLLPRFYRHHPPAMVKQMNPTSMLSKHNTFQFAMKAL
jgi:hypothetical protein